MMLSFLSRFFFVEQLLGKIGFLPSKLNKTNDFIQSGVVTTYSDLLEDTEWSTRTDDITIA